MCPNCNHVFEIDGHVSSHDLKSLKEIFLVNGFEILYLDNFNFKYALKYGSLVKKLYRIIFYYLLKHRSKYQIEFIVKVSD